MSAAALALPSSRIESTGRTWRLMDLAKDVVVGTSLSTNPVTAVVVLGWLMRRMAWLAGAQESRPGWILGNGGSLVTRSIGGLWENVVAGLGAMFTLGLVTLPFTALWTLAWWAGWENSFNKGYEQAAVGPLLSFTAVAMALPLLSIIPMALAHQAVTGSWRAFFDWRQVPRLMARSGWRYLLLSVLTAVLALPVMVLRVLPPFVEAIIPGFADMTAGQVADVQGLMTLAFAAYAFLSLLVLRGGAARTYRHAVLRLSERPPHWLLRAAGWAVMTAASFGFVAQIYVAQFFNHGWAKWFTHPHFLLPWGY